MLRAIPLLAVIRRNSRGKQVADSTAGSSDNVKGTDNQFLQSARSLSQMKGHHLKHIQPKRFS